MNRRKSSLRATLLGMVANTFLAAGKLCAGVLGSSHALVADAVESLADIFSSLVVWRGLVLAEEPADENHPYGHGKAEPIAAAMVASMLLFAAAGIAIKSVRDILSGGSTSPKAITLVVLVGVVVLKIWLYRYVSDAAAAEDSTAVHADAWHHRSDAITSLAAAIGITVSLVGGPRYAAADDVAAVVAALIIACNGWIMLRPALDELMDASPNQKVI
jgi:cation diffusion facilitator family transporter